MAYLEVLTPHAMRDPDLRAMLQASGDEMFGVYGHCPEAFKASPSNVHLVLDFLGYDFRSRDVVTVFVCRSLRWFLLGTARMLLVTS
jgi:hypothetical protein